MRPGERIGNYTILSKIGEGGMSIVYLAEHASEGTRVVVKELKEQHRFNEQLVDRFLREAEILQSLRHPHLARVFDVLLHEGKHYIIQEHLSGGSLADLLRDNKPYSEQEAIRWCCDALRAMNYAHENGIVHRDLKPSNLMLDDRRQVRVIDFGIARAFGQERLTRTSDGSIGTLEYMSPEQILSPNQIDHLTDVYSMGIVLYELLSGSVPFEGPTPFSVQEKIARQAPPPLRRGREITPLRPDGNGIDPQLTRIVFRALEKRPDRRFGGCAEFSLQLEQYLTQQTRHSGGLTWVALRPLVPLLILIVALTAWWGNSSTSSDPGRQEQKQQEAERQARIEKQREAERQAQIQKQQEAARQAQTAAPAETAAGQPGPAASEPETSTPPPETATAPPAATTGPAPSTPAVMPNETTTATFRKRVQSLLAKKDAEEALSVLTDGLDHAPADKGLQALGLKILDQAKAAAAQERSKAVAQRAARRPKFKEADRTMQHALALSRERKTTASARAYFEAADLFASSAPRPAASGASRGEDDVPVSEAAPVTEPEPPPVAPPAKSDPPPVRPKPSGSVDPVTEAYVSALARGDRQALLAVYPSAPPELLGTLRKRPAGYRITDTRVYGDAGDSAQVVLFVEWVTPSGASEGKPQRIVLILEPVGNTWKVVGSRQQ